MYQSVSKRSAAGFLGVVAIAAAVAGCNWDAASAGIRQQKISLPGSEPREVPVGSIPRDWPVGAQPIGRSQVDAVRGRLWSLTSDGVDLYEVGTRRKLTHIPLPGWVWVGEPYNCAPDLALGPGGEVLISSNVVPTLWRIDPATLAASKHELVLDDASGRDIGFTGLAYSREQGAFFAVSGLHGSMWRIDPLFRTARGIPLSAPLPNACGLAILPRASDRKASRSGGFCVRADQQDWTVSLAPDQRSGYARSGQCSG